MREKAKEQIEKVVRFHQPQEDVDTIRRIKILRKLKKHGKKANELKKTINFVFERNF